MMTTTNGVRFLGTTDEIETCDCCGKSNLKVTVALLFPDADEAVYYGTTCAARALSMPAKDVRRAARSMDEAHADALREEGERIQRAKFDADQAILDAEFPEMKGERFLQLQELRARGVVNPFHWIAHERARGAA